MVSYCKPIGNAYKEDKNSNRTRSFMSDIFSFMEL